MDEYIFNKWVSFYNLKDFPLIVMINHYKICLYNIMSLRYLLKL